jgi:hypothetical protein
VQSRDEETTVNRHVHYPNPAGTACVDCGLAAVPDSPEETVRILTRKLRAAGVLDESCEIGRVGGQSQRHWCRTHQDYADRTDTGRCNRMRLS